MPLENPEISWWARALAHASFASIGGILGHVLRELDKGGKIAYARAAVDGIAAGFIGLLFLLLCDAMNLSLEWTGVIVGVSGWLGANASIRLLEAVVYKKLGVDKKDVSSEGG